MFFWLMENILAPPSQYRQPQSSQYNVTLPNDNYVNHPGNYQQPTMNLFRNHCTKIEVFHLGFLQKM